MSTFIRTFDGTYDDNALMVPGTDPWVEIDGVPVDWTTCNCGSGPNTPLSLHASICSRRAADRPNACETCAGEPVAGVIAPMNTREGIQRCDECERFEGDLDAALALARLVGGTVKYVAAD